MDYKKTLNLPDTPFPMRGDLAKREPAWIAPVSYTHLASISRAALLVNVTASSPKGEAWPV